MLVNFFTNGKRIPIQNDLFLGGGGGGSCGGGGGGGEHNVQMVKMALLLFKEYKCAKLF